MEYFFAGPRPPWAQQFEEARRRLVGEGDSTGECVALPSRPHFSCEIATDGVVLKVDEARTIEGEWFAFAAKIEIWLGTEEPSIRVNRIVTELVATWSEHRRQYEATSAVHVLAGDEAMRVHVKLELAIPALNVEARSLARADQLALDLAKGLSAIRRQDPGGNT